MVLPSLDELTIYQTHENMRLTENPVDETSKADLLLTAILFSQSIHQMKI